VKHRLTIQFPARRCTSDHLSAWASIYRQSPPRSCGPQIRTQRGAARMVCECSPVTIDELAAAEVVARGSGSGQAGHGPRAKIRIDPPTAR